MEAGALSNAKDERTETPLDKAKGGMGDKRVAKLIMGWRGPGEKKKWWQIWRGRSQQKAAGLQVELEVELEYERSSDGSELIVLRFANRSDKPLVITGYCLILEGMIGPPMAVDHQKIPWEKTDGGALPIPYTLIPGGVIKVKAPTRTRTLRIPGVGGPLMVSACAYTRNGEFRSNGRPFF